MLVLQRSIRKQYYYYTGCPLSAQSPNSVGFQVVSATDQLTNFFTGLQNLTLLCVNRLLNGSSVTKFEVCKSDVEVLERLETFNVTAITLPEDACSDAATPKTVTIANETYTLCVLTGADPLFTVWTLNL